MRVGYIVSQTARGIAKSPLIQVAAIGAMTVMLVLAGIAALAYVNIERLTHQWGSGTHMIVYLQSDAELSRVERLKQLLERRPEIAAVTLVSAQEAFDRLKRSLGAKTNLLLDGVENDFLPASLEIRLSPGVDPAANPLIALLESIPEVAEIDNLGHWASRLGNLAGLARAAAALFAAVLALACLYVVTSTIRLGIHARRDEIDIQRMLGATERFVRAPFLLEGSLQGLLSAAAATTTIFLGYRWIAPQISTALGSMLSSVEMIFFPPVQIVMLLAIGLALGFIGSQLAVASQREQL